MGCCLGGYSVRTRNNNLKKKKCMQNRAICEANPAKSGRGSMPPGFSNKIKPFVIALHTFLLFI